MKLHRSLPLTEQVAHIIRERIADGEYLPGEQIPSEFELSKEFETSRATIRTAIGELVVEGILTRRQGVGTFVDPRARLQSGLEKLESVISMASRQGLVTSPADVIVETIDVDTHIAEKLQVPVGTPVTCIRRTIAVDDQRVSYQEDYTLTRWLGEADIDENFTGSVLDILLRHHKSLGISAVAEFTAVRTSPKLQEVLGVSADVPLILLKETVLTKENTPMSFSHNYFVPERFYWQVIRRLGP